MELFSVETLGHGSVDVITHELTPIGEVLLGSDYDKTALTTITLSAEDFIPQVRENHNPGLFKHTLRFVRKDKYPKYPVFSTSTGSENCACVRRWR